MTVAGGGLLFFVLPQGHLFRPRNGYESPKACGLGNGCAEHAVDNFLLGVQTASGGSRTRVMRQAHVAHLAHEALGQPACALAGRVRALAGCCIAAEPVETAQ